MTKFDESPALLNRMTRIVKMSREAIKRAEDIVENEEKSRVSQLVIQMEEKKKSR